MMELRQLECFLAVVDEGTFTAAAARLHVVQSAVSTTIKMLERSLGVAVFDRGPGRPVLTDAGRRLLPPARQLLELAATTREAVRTELIGELRVGVLTAVRVDLPAMLSRYRAAHPQVHVRLRAMPRGSADLVDALRTGTLDVAFVSAGAVDPSLSMTLIARDPLTLLLPPNHSLADGPLSLQTLADETWIDGPPGYGNRTVVDAAFVKAGLSREVALEVADFNDMPAYVAAGLGIGFAPPGIHIPPTVHKRHLDTDDLHWPLYLATTKDRQHRPMVKAFTDLFTGT
jgi:DNA-binding transcriptional LysR family regulator